MTQEPELNIRSRNSNLAPEIKESDIINGWLSVDGEL